jgi:hypothetical protein
MSVKALYDKLYGGAEKKAAAPAPSPELVKKAKEEFVAGKVASAAFFDELEKINRAEAGK